MHIRFHFIVLIGISVCLLACSGGDKSGEPSNPAPLPKAPRLTPTTAPAATPIATATASLAPDVTSSPNPTGIDPTQEEIPYSARPAWRALLKWPDDCEEGLERFAHAPQDEGGISIYPLEDGQYLVIVLCNLGPYWEEERAYWLDYRADPPTAWPLTVPELVQDDAPEQGLHDVEVLYGSFPTYHPDTQTLTTLHAYRGMKDCGVFYRYHIEDARFVLDEARYRNCDDPVEDDISPLDTDTWSLVYPAKTTSDYAGPFRKVISLDSDLQGEITRLEALPNGDLRLLTTAGYALLHSGAWQPYFLAPSQRFIGVDGAGRLWFFPEETPAAIFYWDSALADYGGSAFVHADAGWMPVDDPATLVGRGVLTDDRGQVWLATDQDVRVYADGRWTLFTREAMDMPRPADPDWLAEFTLTFAAAKQQMWVGECDWAAGPMGGGGARWLETSAFTTGEFGWGGALTHTSQGCVTAIAADADGNVWIGAGSGIVLHFDPARNHRQFVLPEPADYRRGYALTLALDADGDPWLLAALCGGASCDVMRALYHLQGGAWIEVMGLQDYPEALYQGATLPVLFDETGTPWFFFGGMAFRITDNRLEPPAVVGLNVWDATTDAEGQIWVAANTRNDSPALWVLEPDK